MQGTLSVNDSLLANGFKLLLIGALSLVISAFIVEKNVLYMLMIVVLFVGCYFFVNEQNFIYMVLFLPFEHLIIFESGFADFRLVQVIFVVVFISMACKKYVFRHPLRFFDHTGLDTPLWFMLAVYVISSVFSAYLSDNVREILQLIYLICLFKFFASVLDSRQKLEKAFLMWVLGGALVVVNIFSAMFMSTALMPCVRVSPTGSLSFSFGMIPGISYFFIAPNFTYRTVSVLGMGGPGLALLSIIGFFLSFGFFRRRDISLSRKTGWGLMSIFFFTGLLLCHSRASLLAVIIGVLLLAFKRRRFLELGLLFFVFLYVLVLPTNTHYRFLESFTPEEGSFKSHLTSWESCMQMFWEKPLLGFGPGSYARTGDVYSTFWNDIDDPHSFIMLSAAELGALGLIAELWFALSILVKGWRDFIDKNFGGLNMEVFAILVACFILAATTPVFLTGYFWGFMGSAYACINYWGRDEGSVSAT
jgi:O-antigen ligase